MLKAAADERRIWDISPVLESRIGVWPGDVAFSSQKSLRIKDGHNIDLGSMSTTFHVGAHADAPAHYAGDGVTIEAVDLAPYLGGCQVIDVSAKVGRHQRISPKHLDVLVTSQRVLFKTNTFLDPNSFTTDFASLSAELVDWLGKKGVLLIGIDTPSVDLFEDKVLESHQALMRNSIRNLEGLVLHQVKPGSYELIALPLKIKDADASPVRAILRSI